MRQIRLLRLLHLSVNLFRIPNSIATIRAASCCIVPAYKRPCSQCSCIMAPRSSARLKALSENTLLPPPSQSAAKSKSVGQGRKRKTPADGEDAAPETPKKRSRKAVLKKPPQTPTPAAISLMSVPYSSGDVDDATPPPPVDRVANPLTTNAPLVSPETKRLVHNAAIEDLSPTKASKNKTTKTILEDAVAHLLSVDPRLKPVIEKHHCRVFSEEGLAEEIDPFRSLASGIISQQVRYSCRDPSIRILHSLPIWSSIGMESILS